MNKKNESLKNTGLFLAFAGPAVFAFMAVVIIPFLYGFYLTFTSWDGLSKSKPFVGLANYAELFKDTGFWQALGLTLIYVVVSVVLVNVVAFLLALLVTGKLRGKKFFRAGFFVPNLIGGIVLGYIWQFIFKTILVYIGKNAGIGFLSKSWLSSPVPAFIALIIVTVWQLSGYMMLIYIAGLTSVSADLREAAKIDGCTESQVTRSIVIPLMRSSFTICLFLTITRCFMVYDLNLALTEGGPFGSTVMAAMYVYNKAFVTKSYGPGQTEAGILFLFYMFPFFMIVLNSFKDKRDITKLPLSFGGKKGFTIDNYITAFQRLDFLNVFKNSFLVTGISVLLIILFSSMCAYIFVRKDWKINKLLFLLMMFSMVIPFQVVMIPLISIYGGMFRLLNHRYTLIFMHLGFSVSMAVFMYHGFIKESVPLALEEAAHIDGAGPFRTYFSIVFPLLKAPTATLVILYVLSLWNDYLLPSLILTDKKVYTLPVAMSLFQGTYSNQMDLLLSGLVMSIIPIIILYVVLQKYIIAGVVAGAVKS